MGGPADHQRRVAREARSARLERLLIVEDHEPLRRALTARLSERAAEVRGAASVREAEGCLRGWRPDAIVLDFALPDGDAFDVLRAVAELDTLPLLVVMSGVARPDQSFRLAQLGVRAFVAKPIEVAHLDLAFEVALREVPDLRPLLRAAVGHRSVHEVEEQVRATMVAEALARARGSRTSAARMLAISRQLLQHILKRA
jgi:two-component system, response regulator RegA